MVEAVVVDDSHFMRVQITELLEDGGITVVGDARNGKKAIEAVERHAPDVVTMDVKMPGMDGISAVENIMARNPTPILMLSRYTEEGAETTIYLCTEPGIESKSGRYFAKSKPIKPSKKVAIDNEACKKLWEISEQFVSVSA